LAAHESLLAGFERGEKLDGCKKSPDGPQNTHTL